MPKIVLAIISFLVGIIILLAIISDSANYYFNRWVNKEVESLLLKSEGADKKIISKSDIERLPGSVQKWLKYAQVIGKERIVTTKVEQEAQMRLKKGQAWMPLTAEEYFTLHEPGFVWNAKINAAPFIHIVGRDKYFDGKGNMLIKIMSLITVADSRGKEIDQGTLLRFLGETVWSPTAALEHYIQWEEIDVHSAKATMNYGDVTASGVFTFGESGEVKNFTAQRFGDFNGKYSLETWSIDVSAYKDFNGIKVPTKGEVTWKLDEGDFNWYNFTILNVEHSQV